MLEAGAGTATEVHVALFASPYAAPLMTPFPSPPTPLLDGEDEEAGVEKEEAEKEEEEEEEDEEEEEELAVSPISSSSDARSSRSSRKLSAREAIKDAGQSFSAASWILADQITFLGRTFAEIRTVRRKATS